jgi:hypothetical protein
MNVDGEFADKGLSIQIRAICSNSFH